MKLNKKHNKKHKTIENAGGGCCCFGAPKDAKKKKKKIDKIDKITDVNSSCESVRSLEGACVNCIKGEPQC